MSLAIAGAAVGGGAGVGLVLATARLPVFRRPTLDDRLAPYLVVRGGAASPAGAQALADRVGRALARRAADLLGGSDAVRRRLERAGRGTDLDQLRAEQVASAALGLMSGGAVAGLLWWRGSASAGPPLVVRSAARRRRTRLRDVWPDVVDNLASAGASTIRSTP
jgi:tight adherence protein C